MKYGSILAQNSSDDEWNVDSGDEGGGGKESSSKNVYVSVKDRRKERLIKLGRITAVKDEEDRLQTTSSGANSSGANSSAEDNDDQVWPLTLIFSFSFL